VEIHRVGLLILVFKTVLSLDPLTVRRMYVYFVQKDPRDVLMYYFDYFSLRLLRALATVNGGWSELGLKCELNYSIPEI
jgi:hypothetical protein